MNTLEIPSPAWEAFFNLIDERFGGWRVRIEVMSLSLGDQPMFENLPFQSASFERVGSEAGDVLIGVGDFDDFLIHHIDHPRTVRFLQAIDRGEVCVQIEAEDGTTTLVLLRCPLGLPPGNHSASDGTAPSERIA